MEHIRAVLGGSGADAFNEDAVVERLLGLVPAARTDRGRQIQVAYLGTATYDLLEPQAKQTGGLARRGCHVRAIQVSDPALAQLPAGDAAYLREEADIIIVSGGNTLYAVERWERLGLDALLRDLAGRRGAGEREVVLAGGSAGAICWFTAGHSRSADPATFRTAMLAKAAAAEESVASETPATTEAPKEEGTWSYIRVHGLDVLPGLLCPHYDVAQGDRAVRREEDFAAMMLRHPTERGIALDHWATLVLPGDGSYEVLAVPGHTRHSGAGEPEGQASAPGLFVLEVDGDGALQRRRADGTGSLAQLLRPVNEKEKKDLCPPHAETNAHHLFPFVVVVVRGDTRTSRDRRTHTHTHTAHMPAPQLLHVPFPLSFSAREDAQKKKVGEVGYRSQYLPHAKRSLYHLSYIPDAASLSAKTHLEKPQRPSESNQRRDTPAIARPPLPANCATKSGAHFPKWTASTSTRDRIITTARSTPNFSHSYYHIFSAI
ncbi:Peptidase family S51 [Novymonas esmeraldas]|uniref:Peptidase family S51 n=1 Tax=Novymonas esmeraldas TaxID=1808958 RepID=A0AAW0EM68_9TRYP